MLCRDINLQKSLETLSVVHREFESFLNHFWVLMSDTGLGLDLLQTQLKTSKTNCARLMQNQDQEQPKASKTKTKTNCERLIQDQDRLVRLLRCCVFEKFIYLIILQSGFILYCLQNGPVNY